MKIPEFFTKRSDGTEMSTCDESTNLNYTNDLGFPGEAPFTRGIQPTMYRGRTWTMRQYSGLATADETNKRFHLLLKGDKQVFQPHLIFQLKWVLMPMPPWPKVKVGRVGVSISSIEDMERLFQNISLDQVSTSMTINSTASILLAFYIAVAKKTTSLSKNFEEHFKMIF